MNRLKNELEWLMKYNPELAGDEVAEAKNFW